jgi:hypothetical protein
MISAFGIEHGDISKSKKRTAAEVAVGGIGGGIAGFGVRDDFNASGIHIEGNKWASMPAKINRANKRVRQIQADRLYGEAGKLRNVGRKKMLAGGALVALGAYSHNKAKRQGQV